MKSISLSLWTALGVAAVIAWPSSKGVAAITYVHPHHTVFSPNGSADEPWTRLNEAAGASDGGTVEVLGTDTVFGSHRIDRPCKLTRNSANGTVKIGAVPLAQTTFRCVSFNARLNGQLGSLPFNFLPYGWADAERARAIRDFDFGNPDFIGFCEVWNTDWYYNQLQATPQMSFGMTGFTYGDTHHSGLCAVSRWQFDRTSDQQVIYADGAGEDNAAAKGFIKGRVIKDGLGIWLYMTHTQADAQTTWYNIYTTRKNQFTQLRSDLVFTRIMYPSDVFLVMGDFNVYGEDRGPLDGYDGAMNDEYTANLKNGLGTLALGPLDVAKQFWPQRTDHTYAATENSLIAYWDGGYAKEMYSGRLDYIFCYPSLDGKIKIEPTDYQVIKPKANSPISGPRYPNSASTLTDANLSDHYAIRGDFRIIRVGN